MSTHETAPGTDSALMAPAEVLEFSDDLRYEDRPGRPGFRVTAPREGSFNPASCAYASDPLVRTRHG